MVEVEIRVLRRFPKVLFYEIGPALFHWEDLVCNSAKVLHKA